jgi:hypothetical protein
MQRSSDRNPSPSGRLDPIVQIVSSLNNVMNLRTIIEDRFRTIEQSATQYNIRSLPWSMTDFGDENVGIQSIQHSRLGNAMVV